MVLAQSLRKAALHESGMGPHLEHALNRWIIREKADTWGGTHSWGTSLQLHPSDFLNTTATTRPPSLGGRSPGSLVYAHHPDLWPHVIFLLLQLAVTSSLRPAPCLFPVSAQCADLMPHANPSEPFVVFQKISPNTAAVFETGKEPRVSRLYCRN